MDEKDLRIQRGLDIRFPFVNPMDLAMADI